MIIALISCLFIFLVLWFTHRQDAINTKGIIQTKNGIEYPEYIKPKLIVTENSVRVVMTGNELYEQELRENVEEIINNTIILPRKK